MDQGMAACCGVTSRRNVSDLFDRGLRRNRAPSFAHEGASQTFDGLTARFSLAMDGHTLAAVGFRASTCVTLIAYCELIAELMTGQPITCAAGLSSRDLIDALPDVPALKRDRALLAIAAFRGALAASRMLQQGETNESRVYLRHATP